LRLVEIIEHIFDAPPSPAPHDRKPVDVGDDRFEPMRNLGHSDAPEFCGPPSIQPRAAVHNVPQVLHRASRCAEERVEKRGLLRARSSKKALLRGACPPFSTRVRMERT